MEKEKGAPIVALLGIFTLAWVLVFVGTVIIFEFIIPFSFSSFFYNSIAKAVFTTILAMVWLYLLLLLRNVAVKRLLSPRNHSSWKKDV